MAIELPAIRSAGAALAGVVFIQQDEDSTIIGASTVDFARPAA